MLRYLSFAPQASQFAMSASNLFPFLANRCLAMLPLFSTPLIVLLVAGEGEVCSLLEHGDVVPCWISGKMTVTLDLTTITAMLVVSFYRYAFVWLCYRFAQPLL